MPSGFGTFDGLTEWGPFEWPLKLGKRIYVVVSLTGDNNTFSAGPYMDAPGASSPLLNAVSIKNGVKLLDTHAPPSSNLIQSGYTGCFRYQAQFGIVGEWEQLLAAGFTVYPNLTPPPTPFVNGSCAAYATQGFLVGPVNYINQEAIGRDYLFSIPASAGASSISAVVSGLLANTNTGPLSTTVFHQKTTSGSGGLAVRVFSTVKGKVTKLSQLVNYSGDNHPRPTEDDEITLTLTQANQGSFIISVKQNKKITQIDNYGKKYHPYKITLNRGHPTDFPPPQPPPRLH